MEQVVGQQGEERRAGEVVTRAEQRVAQPARVVLRHELELQRALVVAGGGLEQRLVRVGDDDGAKQAGVRGLVERPVEDRAETHGQDLLGKPAGDRVQPGSATPAWDDRGIHHHGSILYAMPSEPSPRREGEQGRVGWTTADLLSAVRIPLALAFPFVSNDARLVLLAAAAGQRSARRPARPAVRQLRARRDDRSGGGQAVHGVGLRRRGLERRLEWYEILGVLLRDIVATIAFAVTYPLAPAARDSRRAPAARR